MQSMRLLFVVLGLAVAAQAARLRREEKYSTQYDNVDLHEILTNKRLMNNYANCLLDKGPCTQDAQLLKDAIPDALENECAKCSEKQKEGTEIAIPHMIENEPEIWELLKKKFDPSNKYGERYAQLLKKAQEKRRG